MPDQSNTYGNFGVPMIQFQLDEISIEKKSNYDWGLKIAQDIESKINGGMSSYFWIRNQRWKTNRNYAHGKISMQRFMDLLEFNGKINYVNVDWQCIKIVNRIISGLVGRWMGRNEKINVTAIDTLSTNQKRKEYEDLEAIILSRRELEQLEVESGMQLIPKGDLPEDEEELKLWQAQFQRLPEEILYQLGINDVLSSNGWFDVLKEKMLHDSAETGFVATYTWMDEHGVIHVEWLKPENCFYSYSNYPDFRDTAWRGYMRTRTISEIRRMYGREFHPNNKNSLTEEQLFKMAQTAKEYQLYDNITWLTEWNVTFLRPYDEWNVDILEFELKTTDIENYTQVTTKKNKSTILKKGRSNKLAENEVNIEDRKVNIYRGVYARTTQTMLEWGIKTNMIRPQDPKESGNAEFSYSFYMVQNYDMTTLGIPEKIQEPADQMIIARLKMQQLVAKMVPAGAAINWDALQNIDYGVGEENKNIDVIKMFEQTGKLYYRGRDAEGNPIPIPYVEMPNAGFFQQLQGLILIYDKHYQIMRDELGEDPNLITQAMQPRVTEGNVQVSQQQAEFSTDQYYRAYSNVMVDTARKVSCLLKDSVTYGSNAYRTIVNQEDIEGRIFTTKMQFLPDALAVQKFEALINGAIAASPELLSFLDPFQLIRVAKEDVELAETLFRRAQKKMIMHQQQTARENQEATFNAQVQSGITAEEEKRKTEQQKGDIEIKKVEMSGESENKKTLLSSIMKMYETGVPIPAELKPLVNEILKNIAIPTAVQNQQMQQQVIMQMEQAEMQENQESEVNEQIQQQTPQIAA